MNAKRPVAIIGAGPVGLAAAAHLVARGETPVVLEAGAKVGASIREWGHVRMFSSWEFGIDKVAGGLMEASGWTRPPASALPTGRELVERYLEPLAKLPALRPHIQCGARVVAITRKGFDKVRSTGRDAALFELVVRTGDGAERRIEARAVIDASGTWTAPNPIGAGGIWAEGEQAMAGQIRYGIPDVLGQERARYADQAALVVGSGHSAMNALLDLARLKAEAPRTKILWALRRSAPDAVYGGGDADQLPERGALGTRLRTLVASRTIAVVAGFRIARIAPAEGGGMTVSGWQDDRPHAVMVDQVIAATGFRPDLAVTRELRLGLDSWLECPAALAPMIDPNLHSCGTVRPHGARELAHPEREFYTVGMKSYGRAPTFLLATGYEQVRSVVAALVGDHEAAARVELALPETGVCNSRPAKAASSCCGPSPAPVELESERTPATAT